MLRVIVFLAALLAPALANAAMLISTASGNINATGTWSVADTTGTNAFLNSETANTALTTSPVASSTFTPAAETLTEIGVKLASVAASPSGVMTIKLANSTSPGSRECTQTVNVADLPSGASPTSVGGPDGGWVILTCAASPNGTDAYTITASTSVAAQVNLFSLLTTNWSRLLVTNTAAAPGAGDSFIVEGQLTGAGTHNAFTVTINTTANINYGNVANTMVSPSIAVGQFGTLAYATTSATNFTAEVAGPLIVYNGGTFTEGASGSPIPMSASCTDSAPCGVFTFNSTVEGDTGLTCRNGSTCGSAGQPRTVGKNVWQTHLFLNIAAGAQTSLTVSDDTGWKSGDRIVVAATDKVSNSTHSETTTLTSDATSTTLPISLTFANPHLGEIVSYTSTNTGLAYSFPTQAEIILLTRNVRFQGASDTQPGYIYCAPTAKCTFDWTEFKWISGNAAGQFGLESDTAGGTWSVTNFSFHDSHDASIYFAATQSTWGGTVAAPAKFQNGAVYNAGETSHSVSEGCAMGMATSTSNQNWMIDNITILAIPQQNDGLCLKSYGGQLTNFVCADIPNGGNCMQASSPAVGNGYSLGNWGPLTFHSNSNFDANWTANGVAGTINGMYVYHSYGFFFTANANDITADPFYGLGNGVLTGSKGNVVFTMRNGFLASDNTFGAGKPPLGIDEGFNIFNVDNIDLCPIQTVSLQQSTGTTTGNSLFISCSTGNGSHASINPVNDVGLTVASPTTLKFTGRNTAFLSADDALAPGLFGQYFMTPDSYVCTEWLTNHECFLTYGIVLYDTTISGFKTTYTTRLWPIVPRFTASSAGVTLTVSGASYPLNSVSPNMFIFGTTTTFPAGTQIINGAPSVWTLNNPVTAGSQTMMGSAFPNQNCVLSQCRLQSAALGHGLKVGVNSGGTVSECVNVRESLNTDPNFTFDGVSVAAATYNGDPPRLILRRNPQMGIANDTVLATYSASAGTVQQICGTTPAAPRDGMFEFAVDADMTPTSNAGGFVSIGDWLSSGGAAYPNGNQRYFKDGMPFDTNVPNNSGTTLIP